MYQIRSYVLNFLVEKPDPGIGSGDQAMDYSSFHMMSAVGIEVQITTRMSRFPVNFCSQFMTPLQDEVIRKWTSIIHFQCEFHDRSNTVEVVVKLLQSCCPCGQTTKVQLTYLSHLAGLWSSVSSAISSKCSIHVLLITGDSFPFPYPLFVDRIYPQIGNM
jgi:hypothetical protein